MMNSKKFQSCYVDPTSGHLGIKKTLSRITERFMWPGVSKDVELLVSKHLKRVWYVIVIDSCIYSEKKL